MNFRIQVRKHDDVYEAWAPGVHGAKAVGATEEAAIQHLQEVLKAEYAGNGPVNGYQGEVAERVIEVDVEHAMHEPVSDPVETDFSKERMKLHLQFGILGLLLGLTGIIFAFIGGYASFPLMLFAPIVMAGFGVLGIVMSVAARGSIGKGA